MLPTIPDVAAFATAPLLVKRAYFLRLLKTSRAGTEIQLPKHCIGTVIGPTGITATPPAAIVIAPSEVNNLPSMLLFAPSVTAPGCANKVPFIILDAPTEIAP